MKDVECENFRGRKREVLTLLGSPLFRGEALDECGDTLDRVLKDLEDIKAQAALLLLRSCFGAAKIIYMMRTSPCWNHPILEKMDHQMRTRLQKILNNELTDMQWLQVSFPIRDGGLGTRQVLILASSVYLGSWAPSLLRRSGAMCTGKK